MAAAPRIDVYASLPSAEVLGPDLDVDPAKWRWVHCLTLPLERLNTLQFSQKQYKWIRYSIGVVVGAEGVLSTSPNLITGVDDNTVPPAEFASLYYHTSDQEKQRMFPVDPRTARTNITSSVHTTRRAKFRDEVADRDGRRCLLSDYADSYCDAVHLLPHSKGDIFISTYTQHRSRSPTGDDIICDIDSARNGLFLNRIAHWALGKDLAFMMTPNFAMDTTDVDPAASPTATRCTSHLFQEDLPEQPLSPHSPLRISDTPGFPPLILFDAVYAGAVVHHFGTQALKDTVTATWKDMFHPAGAAVAADADRVATDDKRAMNKQKEQVQDCENRHEARNTPDIFDMLMILPYIMVPKDKLQSRWRAAEEEAEAAEQKRVREKVDEWMRQVPTV